MLRRWLLTVKREERFIRIRINSFFILSGYYILATLLANYLAMWLVLCSSISGIGHDWAAFKKRGSPKKWREALEELGLTFLKFR